MKNEGRRKERGKLQSHRKTRRKERREREREEEKVLSCQLFYVPCGFAKLRRHLFSLVISASY